jgi:hypothetical protein
VPLGLTLIEAQKYASRAEQLAVLKTFAEGELLRRLPFRTLVGGLLTVVSAAVDLGSAALLQQANGSIWSSSSASSAAATSVSWAAWARSQ